MVESSFDTFVAEFALQIVLIITVAIGASVFAYFSNLKKCVKKHKEETNAKIEIIEQRTIRFAKAFLHFVRRNDELHRGEGRTPPIKLGDEIENLLQDDKGNL